MSDHSTPNRLCAHLVYANLKSLMSDCILYVALLPQSRQLSLHSLKAAEEIYLLRF